MTVTSRAPYLDFGVKFDAELALTVFEVVLEPELVVAVEWVGLAVVFAATEPVATLEFPLLVPVVDEVPLNVDVLELSAKTPPDEEDCALEVTDDATLELADEEGWVLEATDDATLEPADEVTALPLQEPETLML
jgi:hypothetical protein